jgi:poly(A) RNA polymerase
LEDQMLVLHRATCLNDLGIRLRFLAAKQIEDSLKGMFPNSLAFPFGSSVNGFGKMGCDLDLILKFNQDVDTDAKNSRLIFHTKANLSNERSQVQRQMECVGDILQLFLPGISNVRRILQARVPIIKFNHEYLDLEVDLSMSNL